MPRKSSNRRPGVPWTKSSRPSQPSPGIYSGPANGKWKGGTTLNSKGYLRYSSSRRPHAARPNAGRYVHRVVMADLCAVFCYYPTTALTVLGRPTGLPPGFTVEHLDHRRTHNCPSNLLLLQTEIHNHLSWASWLNKPVVGDVPGQEPVMRGPDDHDGIERFTSEELAEVPF